MDQKSFIFLDLRGKRWQRFRLAFFLGLCVFFVTSVFFIRSLLDLPRLQQLAKVHDLSNKLKAIAKTEAQTHRPELPKEWFLKKNQEHKYVARGWHHPADPGPVRLAFYVNWDKRSFDSLALHADKITHLSPEWFSVSGVQPELHVEPDGAVETLAESYGFALLPLLSNIRKDQWDPEVVETLIHLDPAEQEAFIDQVVKNLEEVHAKGVIVDFEQIDPTYQNELTLFFTRMHSILSEKALELWICIPMGNDIKAFDIEALSGVVDRFVAMLYDESGDDDPPGPLVSHDWFIGWLKELVRKAAPDQWVIGLGGYGYDWQGGEKPLTISFTDAMSRANAAGEPVIENSPPYNGPHFEYADKGIDHAVWFLDAVTFRNQKIEAEREKVGGIALWRLGTEDPQVWDTFACVNSCEPHNFEVMKSFDTISHIGAGDFLTTANESVNGFRQVRQDKSGLWSCRYLRYPKYPLLYHQGQNDDHQVAITFDDGPDPEWTPRILDVLREKKAKAAFFLIGANAEAHPELVKRIAAEGHEIGNHTYSHPDLGKVSNKRLRLELNITQRLVESLTGKSTLLFRPPYNADRSPQTFEEYLTLTEVQRLGYTAVSESIDTQDWEQPGVEGILEQVKERRSEGNIVLLHDAGGDRTQTLEALPALIDYLRMRGDEIVPLHRLLGVSPESLMPPIPTDDPKRSRIVAQIGLRTLQYTEELLWAFMIASTAVVCLRTLIVLLLSIRHKKRTRGFVPELSMEPISVVIAAYNESKLIRDTLLSVLNTRHVGPIEVVVVDDGSTDDTAQIVSQVADEDPRVTLLRQSNRGKAWALNAGIAAAANDWIITLDADTQFNEDTIPQLVTYLKDPSVGAVSGHAKVGNLGTWIGRFQSLEYTCGFNLDRRAYDVLDAITVVPGAVSALRRSAVLKTGDIPTDTLAEDTDMTLTLHRNGYKIRYAPEALGWTEAPETVSSLIRQRTRWAFGTLQCLWKHRDLVFNPAFGALAFFSLPTAWFCHIFLVALVPVVDVLLMVSLVTGAGRAMALYALIFLLLDLAMAIVACVMEGEKLKTAWRIIPMRLVYRPLLSIAVWKSLFRAVRGAWVGWGKQDRKGSVAFQPLHPTAGLLQPIREKVTQK
jgi:peptidoglycan-N-acetylglucosamine deacetylase